MPTFDNFKSTHKGSPMHPKKRRPIGESMDFSASKPDRGQLDSLVSESQQWEKYQYDLIQKVKA